MKISTFFKNKEVTNASWIVGCRVLQMLISLLISVLTARFLGPNNYGVINYATAYIAFFTSLCSLGIDSILVKEFITHPDEQGEALGTTLVLQGCASILSVLSIGLIVSVIDQNEPLTVIVVVLCSFSVIFRVFETFKFWFQSKYLSRVSSVAMLSAYIVVSIYKIILLILEKDVRWFAFATSIDFIFMAIFLAVFYKKYGGPHLTFSLIKAKKLLAESHSYIFTGMMVAAYGQVDRLMLKQMLGVSAVAYYSTATSICTMWTFILQAIIDSLYPSIISLKSNNQSEYERKNRQLYAIVFYVSLVVSLLFQVLGELVIYVLYGIEYLPATAPLKIVTWYTAFSYLGVARGAWIVCEGKQKYLKYIYFNAMLINIVLNLSLIPIWGASGAALASLITQIATGLFFPYLIKALRPNAILMLEAIFFKNTIK